MTRPISPLIIAAVLGLTLGACVEKSKRLSKSDREQRQQIISDKPPKPKHLLEVEFEDKVRLLGYDIDEGKITPSVPFTVTWYWHVKKPLGDGWKIFTHVADAKRESRLNVDANRVVREVYPAEDWRAGNYIKDTQEVTLPANWKSTEAIFFMGFYNGPHRLHVYKGKNDGKHRAEVLQLEVVGAGTQNTLPRLVARKIQGPVALDGMLAEADWSAAQTSSDFVDTMTGSEGAFKANVRVLYDASHLYLAFQVTDDHLKSTFSKPDDHLWEQDTVEVMLDPDGDGENYFEIQVSPAGVVFDTRYDKTREPKPFGDLGWNSATQAGVQVSGTLNDDDTDVGYTVEMAVPWSAFQAGPKPAKPPSAGAAWRMNFFVMDSRPKGQRSVGWSPPMVGDFHTLNRFGRVVFPQGAAASAPASEALIVGKPGEKSASEATAKPEPTKPVPTAPAATQAKP